MAVPLVADPGLDPPAATAMFPARRGGIEDSQPGTGATSAAVPATAGTPIRVRTPPSSPGRGDADPRENRAPLRYRARRPAARPPPSGESTVPASGDRAQRGPDGAAPDAPAPQTDGPP